RWPSPPRRPIGRFRVRVSGGTVPPSLCAASTQTSSEQTVGIAPTPRPVQSKDWAESLSRHVSPDKPVCASPPQPPQGSLLPVSQPGEGRGARQALARSG